MKTLKDVKGLLKGNYIALGLTEESTVEYLVEVINKKKANAERLVNMGIKVERNEEVIAECEKDLEALTQDQETKEIEKALEVKEVFETVCGTFNERNISEAMVAIDWRVCKKLLALFGLEYDKNYTEEGYDGRTTAEHNYSRIQADLYTYEDILSSYDWGKR